MYVSSWPVDSLALRLRVEETSSRPNIIEDREVQRGGQVDGLRNELVGLLELLEREKACTFAACSNMRETSHALLRYSALPLVSILITSGC